MKAKLIEIFASIQGEGLWVGKPQVFVRFHGCRLHCTYCDTPLTHHAIHTCRIEVEPFSKQFISHPLEFSPQQLDEEISRFGIRSLALTGGEPLEQAAFIKEWLGGRQKRYEVLLETNGVETDSLREVLPLIDIVSMDVKLPSSSKEAPLWSAHESFLREAQNARIYVKVVYDETMTEEEMTCVTRLMQSHVHVESFIFQPVSPLQKRDIAKCLAVFWRFAREFPEKARFIPQTHKFINIL